MPNTSNVTPNSFNSILYPSKTTITNPINTMITINPLNTTTQIINTPNILNTTNTPNILNTTNTLNSLNSTNTLNSLNSINSTNTLNSLNSINSTNTLNSLNSTNMCNELNSSNSATVNLVGSNNQSKKFHKKFDSNLINPWGIIVINNHVWIANAGSGSITNYNIRGETMMLPITVCGPGSIISQPTGLAYNSSNNSFIVSSGLITGSSSILIVTLGGTIHGYNNMVDPKNTIMVINNSSTDAIYTGITIVNNIMYVANFGNNRIDVFNNKFTPMMGFFFIDKYNPDLIPMDFSPYNIINIGDYLYVTYAKQNPTNKHEVLEGGYINIFTLDGIFVKRFVSRGDLNTPWGLISAPSIFCYPPGTILVANFGNGTINAYTENGNLLGKVLDGNYNEICISALRGLILNTNYDFKVYFSSTSYNLKKGHFGEIRVGNYSDTVIC